MQRVLDNLGFYLGLGTLALVLLMPTPEGLSPEGHRTAALFLLMGIWWATEAVPVAVTALVPLALFPIFGISDIQSAASPYANKIVYLFFGGFLIATAIQKWNLHKRIALIVLESAGSNGASLVGGFMLTAAVISMWVMNTSTTIMLLPIGLAVITVVKDTVTGLSEKQINNFQLALLLGIAYGATIGGMSTLIGTGPNGMLAGFMSDNYNLDISFTDWMLVGVPLSATMLPICWFILTKIIFPINFETSPETRSLLSDLNYAWPSAEVAVMGPEAAIKILYRKELKSSKNPKKLENELLEKYKQEVMTPYTLAENGYIEDLILPDETRQTIINSLKILENKREILPPKKHGNIPL